MPTPSYYFDEKGIIKESLITDDASKKATIFVKDGLTSSQLRKFFNEVKYLEAKVNKNNFPRFKPLIKMIQSKVAYACPERGKKKVPPSFKEFVIDSVQKVELFADFQAFCLTFEAVVGFCYGKGMKQQ